MLTQLLLQHRKRRINNNLSLFFVDQAQCLPDIKIGLLPYPLFELSKCWTRGSSLCFKFFPKGIKYARKTSVKYRKEMRNNQIKRTISKGQ